MKDVTTCDKRRGVGSKFWYVDVRMGKPNMIKSYYFGVKSKKKYVGNWNILVPTGKERLIDFVSSGERKRNSLNYFV